MSINTYFLIQSGGADSTSPTNTRLRRPRAPVTDSESAYNTAAYLLESLHDTQLVPDLGSAMFLRRGENVHRKARNPRPFPPDVIERIDTLIVDNPETDPTLRAMIATTRWAGCRISELVALPLGCLHHSDGATGSNTG